MNLKNIQPNKQIIRKCMIGKSNQMNQLYYLHASVIITLMRFRPFLINLVLLLFLIIPPAIAGPPPPSPPPIPSLICSAFCSPSGCNGFTSNNCNNYCNTAWGWIPVGSACALLSEWGLLDTSSDSGGSLLISPSTTTSSCSSLTTSLNGIAPYGDFKANQTVTVTEQLGTALAHYAVDLIFDMILIDTNHGTASLQWSSCKLIVMLGNATQYFSLQLNDSESSQTTFCGSGSKQQKNFQVQLTFSHNTTNSDIAFSLTTDNPNPNALWVAKEFIVTARLCNIACISCYSSSAANTCFACNVTLGYKLCNTSCLSQCSLGFGKTNNPGKCVWCDLKCTTCYQVKNNCSKCVETGTHASSLVYDKSKGYLTCTKLCPNGSVSTNGQCIKIWGCTGVSFYAETQRCLRCNSTLKLSLVNNTCICKSGYLFNNQQICKQICGDGRLFELKCDDGNLVNGDGCSSTCELEVLFKCYNGTQDHPSNCLYVGAIKVSQVVTSKVEGKNQALITLNIRPKLDIYTKKDFIQQLNFTCDKAFELISWSFVNSQIILEVDYFQSLQGKVGEVSIRMNSSLVRLNEINYQFTITSKGSKLLFSNSQNSALYGFFFQIMGLCALAIFVMSSFSHKMIGVETLNAFQFIYFMCLIETNLTEMYFSLRYLTYTNLNILFYSNKSNNYQQVSQNLPYLPQNQSWTKYSIGTALFLPLLFPILKIIITKNSTVERKVQFLDRARKAIYNCIWFPISAGYLMEMTVMGRQTNPYINFGFSIFLSLVFFYEWKLFFVKKLPKCSADVERVKRNYVAIYLTFSFLMVITVHLANMGLLKYPFEAAASITFLFSCWFVVHRPYKDIIHNVGQLLNLTMLLGFLAWSLLRTYMPETFASDSNQTTAIMVICLFMILSLSLAIARFIYEVRTMYKKWSAPKKSKKSSFKKRMQNSSLPDQTDAVVQEFKKYNRYCVDVMNLQRRFMDSNQFNVSRALNDVFPIQPSQIKRQLSGRIHKRFKIEPMKPDEDQTGSSMDK